MGPPSWDHGRCSCTGLDPQAVGKPGRQRFAEASTWAHALQQLSRLADGGVVFHRTTLFPGLGEGSELKLGVRPRLGL